MAAGTSIAAYTVVDGMGVRRSQNTISYTVWVFPADHALRSKATPCLSYCEAIYACVAGFVLKMPLKLSRYCRKTRIHNTQATSAGAMLPGAIVR